MCAPRRLKATCWKMGAPMSKASELRDAWNVLNNARRVDGETVKAVRIILSARFPGARGWMTQAQLGQLLGLSGRTVARMERGGLIPLQTGYALAGLVLGAGVEFAPIQSLEAAQSVARAVQRLPGS